MRAFTIVILLICINIGLVITQQSGLFPDVGVHHNQTVLSDYISEEALHDLETYDPAEVDGDQGYNPVENTGIIKTMQGIGVFLGSIFWAPSTLQQMGVPVQLTWFVGILTSVIYLMALIQIWRNFGGGSAQ